MITSKNVAEHQKYPSQAHPRYNKQNREGEDRVTGKVRLPGEYNKQNVPESQRSSLTIPAARMLTTKTMITTNVVSYRSTKHHVCISFHTAVVNPEQVKIKVGALSGLLSSIETSANCFESKWPGKHSPASVGCTI